MISFESEGINLSKRCMSSSGPSLPYLDSFLKSLGDPCHPTDNPGGYITLCVAENKLIINELSKRLTKSSVLEAAFNNEINYCYNDMHGILHVREAIAKFITRKFIQAKSETHEEADISAANPDHVVLSSGAGAVLNYLFFSLADDGDVVLIPAPYYAAFNSDMKTIANLKPYAVQQSNPVGGPSVVELDTAFKEVAAQGLTVKMLLLTNPNNPLGTIYSPETILNCVSWARSKKIHTIVDEIYALSLHNPSSCNFQSVTRILNNDLGDDVHMIWALSKDFGASGFRAGVLYSQNEALISAFSNYNIFSSISHPMQAVIADVMSDNDYVDKFLVFFESQVDKQLQHCDRHA